MRKQPAGPPSLLGKGRSQARGRRKRPSRVIAAQRLRSFIHWAHTCTPTPRSVDQATDSRVPADASSPLSRAPLPSRSCYLAGVLRARTTHTLCGFQAKVNGAFSHPAPREFMIEIARAKNAVPLPLIRPGVHLPPPEHCNSFVSMQLAGSVRARASVCVCVSVCVCARASRGRTKIGKCKQQRHPKRSEIIAFKTNPFPRPSLLPPRTAPDAPAGGSSKVKTEASL